MTRDFLSPALVAIFKVRCHMTRFQEVQLISPQVVMEKKLALCSPSHWITTVMLLTGCRVFFFFFFLVHTVMQLQLKTTSQISSRGNCKRLASASSCGFLIDAMHRTGNASCPKHVQIFSIFSLNNPFATSCHVHLQSKRPGRGPCFV